VKKQTVTILLLLLFSALLPAAFAEDTNAECAGEGESVAIIPEPLECCEGLTLILPTDEEILGISGYCTALCGDGECSEIETTYNCPEDCEETETECKGEGESIPVIAEPPECCEGLTLMPPADAELVGISGWCTALCGDGECGENESNYNCPADCEAEGVNPETGEEIVSTATEAEVVAMELGPGAQVRLLQLQKAILRNILRGEKVIEFIQGLDANADVSELQEILAELEVLKDEVAAFVPQGDNEETVKAFVDFKNDAISLSKQFRDASKELIGEADKTALIESFKEIDRTELDALKEQILALIKEYNAQRVEKVFSKLEKKKPEFVEKIRNGEMNMAGVKAAVGKAFKALKPIQRKKAFLNMKQFNAKKLAFQKAKIAAAKLKFLERRVNRLQKRIEAIQNNPRIQAIKDRIRDRIQNRIKKPKRPGLSGIVGGGA